MNLSTAVFLINPDVRAVMCTYEVETETHKPPRVMFKTLDPSIKKGDLVIVPTNTRHNMTINRVVAVDVVVNFEDMTPVQWIVDRVDPSSYERTLAMEEAAKAAITSADRRRRQDEFREALLKDNPELASLPIAGSSRLSPPAPHEDANPEGDAAKF